MSILVTLALMFGRLSLLAIGGINSTVPQIVRDVVTDRHWMTSEQFVQLYAIANAAPGPNLLISTVIGAHMAGVPGALVATFAMILPAATLVLIVSRLWDRYRENRWRRIIQNGLLPITAGLILAAAGILVRQSDHGILTIAITATGAIMIWRTGIHPLWILGGGTVMGLLLA
jgi:chromate transporter